MPPPSIQPLFFVFFWGKIFLFYKYSVFHIWR
jgi:hypothetical protein